MTFYQQEVLNVGGKYVSIPLNRRVFLPLNGHQTNKITLASPYLVIFKHLEFFLVKLQNVQSIPNFNLFYKLGFMYPIIIVFKFYVVCHFYFLFFFFQNYGRHSVF